ncbi:Uncharacterised protein [uncultured archaeon]|nr:Uncharacterised protein [uncultured archaeon]
MKKINLIGIEFAILVMLILIPFVSSENISGFNPATQNLCGDGFCQPSETAATCPADCSSPKPLPSSPTTNPPTNTPPANQPSGVQNNTITNPQVNQPSAGNTTSVNQPASTGNLPAQNSFFASPAFKIILVIIILIVLGIIAYLVIRRKNKTSPAVSNPQVSSPQ